MNEKSAQEKLDELEAERILRNRIAAQSRAVSVTVGTAFGGTTEISMRSDDGRSVWCLMQPVEVVELIHQLSANVGCHVALKPRKDFASWRDWRVTDEEHERLNGWAPFVNDMAPYNQLGAQGKDPEIVAALNAGGLLTEVGGGAGGKSGDPNNRGSGQPGANIFVKTNHGSKENVMAIEKPKNRRNAKRTPKTS